MANKKHILTLSAHLVDKQSITDAKPIYLMTGIANMHFILYAVGNFMSFTSATHS